MNEDLIARHLSIRGKVQGVGYRESMRRQAEQLRIVGWVRNRHDGSVEALIQGTQSAVDALIDWVHQGPMSAKVLRVQVTEDTPQLSAGRFSVWPTA